MSIPSVPAPRRKSSQRPSLTREATVAAALAVADRTGLGGLTMRAVAEELGVGVMSLYHYIENKDQLLDAISDAALAEVPPVPRDVPWEESLRRGCTDFHEVLLRHPSLGQLFAERAISGPNTFRAADDILRVLLDAGFPPAAAVDAFTALVTYTIGASLFSIARSDAAPPAADARRRERLERAGAEGYTALAAVAPHMQEQGTQAQFAYGLDRLITALRDDLMTRP